MDHLTQHELLGRFVREGRLSESDVKNIEEAPKFWLPAREVVSYLGGAIILVGVVRLLIVIFEDASKMSIVAALYLGAVLTGYLALLTQRRTGPWHRFGELMELVTLGSAATATGLWLGESDMATEWSVFISAALVFPWSLFRIRQAEFASLISFPASLMVMAGSLGEILDIRDETSALPFLVAGLMVVLAGTQDISSPRFMRAIGGMVVLMSGPGWSSGRDGFEGVVPVVVIGAILFGLGATRMWLELIPTSSLVIMISTINFIMRRVENEVAQALLIVATGLVVLLGAFAVFKKKQAQKADSSQVQLQT